MKRPQAYRVHWPIADPTVPVAELVREATADYWLIAHRHELHPIAQPKVTVDTDTVIAVGHVIDLDDVGWYARRRIAETARHEPPEPHRAPNPAQAYERQRTVTKNVTQRNQANIAGRNAEMLKVSQAHRARIAATLDAEPDLLPREIAHRLGLSTRTVQRHIIALRDDATQGAA